MQHKEFMTLTGFEVTADEYREIEVEYMNSPAHTDKHRFCRIWLKNGGINRIGQHRIAVVADMQRERDKARAELEDLNKQFEALAGRMADSRKRERDLRELVESIIGQASSVLLAEKGD